MGVSKASKASRQVASMSAMALRVAMPQGQASSPLYGVLETSIGFLGLERPIESLHRTPPWRTYEKKKENNIMKYFRLDTVTVTLIYQYQ